VVIDTGGRRALPPSVIAEIVLTHRALNAASGCCALVLHPALAALISAAYPEGLLCTSSRAMAIQILSRRPALLDVHVTRTRRAVTLSLVGELDIAGLATTRATLDEVAAEARRGLRVTIDLRELAFIDVGGLRAVTEAALRCHGAGARTRLLGLQPQAQRLLDSVGWSSRLDGIVASDGFERTALGWMNRPDVPESSPARRTAAVIATDLDGYVTKCNDAARRLYGWSREAAWAGRSPN
jgi:anti-anti-sigma factor